MISIGVLDYKAGNLRSVETALAKIGAKFFTSDKPEDLRKADRLIFPGVGEAFSAMQELERSGLGHMLKEYAATGRPLLGICLGSQIIMDASEERDVACLGLIPGRAVQFAGAAMQGLKVPHMGWNQVQQKTKHPVFKGIPQDASFYFVHSYYPKPDSPDNVLCTCDYGIDFCAGVTKDNIVAVQFHPEKSGQHGLRLLQNFAGVDLEG